MLSDVSDLFGGVFIRDNLSKCVFGQSDSDCLCCYERLTGMGCSIYEFDIYIQTSRNVDFIKLKPS
jgi:hypothetical protein